MDLRSKTINGTKWVGISTIMILLLGLGQLIILARLLPQDQFGLVSLS